MSKFSERFRQLKEEKQGMTLKELSLKLDITVPNLSYYMKGREPNYDTLIKIADYFGVTTDWLVGRTDERNNSQSSIISEIENQLSLDENDKLSGKRRELFLYNMRNLYSSMVDMYALFLFTDESYITQFNVYLNMASAIFNYYIREMDKGFRDLSKNSVLTMMKKEEIISDAMQAVILLSSFNYANYLSHDNDLPEEERTILQEIVSFSFSNFKDKYPDKNLFETFNKMGQIQSDD